MDEYYKFYHIISTAKRDPKNDLFRAYVSIETRPLTKKDSPKADAKKKKS
jgi:hypothetical protein